MTEASKAPEKAPEKAAKPAKVKLDYDKLVSEYGRNLADHMMAQQQAGDDIETR